MRAPSNYIAPQLVDATYSALPDGDPSAFPMLSALEAQREASRWGPLMRNISELPKNWRSLPAAQRTLVSANAVDQLFITIGRHVELGLAFDDVLRRGYRRLPPQDARFNRLVRNAAQVVESRRRAERPSSLGMSLIAEPGSGKSVGANQVSQTFPQVIRHRFPEHHDAPYLQLVHLTIRIPPDESVKALCQDFILAADAALGTNYTTQHRVLTRTKSQLLAVMARIAVQHSLGILILDDLQNLSAQFSGGRSTLVGSLVQFSDGLRIPIFAIGTSDALELLDSHPHLNRRLATHALRWKPMEAGAEWTAYVRQLGRFSTTLRPGDLSPRQIESLRRASNGNFHKAAERFLRAVRDAIHGGWEELRPDCFD